MVLYFKQIDDKLVCLKSDGIKEIIESNGSHIVIGIFGSVTHTNGIPAKLLEGWNKAIGFKPAITEVSVAQFKFKWHNNAWYNEAFVI